MVDLKQAIEKAKAVIPTVNRYEEYKKAFVLWEERNVRTIGGQATLVVLKDDGKITSFVGALGMNEDPLEGEPLNTGKF